MRFRMLQLRFMIIVIEVIADKNRGTSLFHKCKTLSDEMNIELKAYQRRIRIRGGFYYV